MENENNRKDGFVLSLGDIFGVLLKKKIIVAIIMVVCIAASLVYSFFFVKPKYVSSTKVYVLGASETAAMSGLSGISASEFTVSTYLVTDYAELVLDRTVIEQVIKELKLKASYEQVRAAIDVSVLDESRVVQISVSTQNPKLSKAIADKVCSVSSEQVFNFLGVDKINQFGKANLPAGNSAISTKTCLMYGVIAGIALSVIFALLYLYFDDSIRSSDDVEKQLGLCILASIPYNSAHDTKKKKSRHKRKAAKR